MEGGRGDSPALDAAAISAAPDKTVVTDGEVNAVVRKIYLGGSTPATSAAANVPAAAGGRSGGGGGGGGGSAGPVVAPSIRTKSARLDRRGRVQIRVRCAASSTEACKGALSLKAKRLKLGSKRFSIARGRTRSVLVKISKKGQTADQAQAQAQGYSHGQGQGLARRTRTVKRKLTLQGASPRRVARIEEQSRIGGLLAPLNDFAPREPAGRPPTQLPFAPLIARGGHGVTSDPLCARSRLRHTRRSSRSSRS